MKYIYIGNTISKNKKIYNKGVSIAGNKMQVGIVNSLKKYVGNELDVLTVYPIASYPREKKIIIKESTIKVTEIINSLSIGFINLPIIKQLTQVIGVYNGIKKLVNEQNNEKVKLICFNAFPYTGLGTIYAGKKYGYETICILADLPIEVIKRNFIGKILRHIDTILTKWCIKKFDKIVALNEEAINIYADKQEFIVIDGGFDLEDIILDEVMYKKDYKNEIKTMIYSGTLIEYNGIRQLIDGIKQSNNNDYVVEIYGDGPMKEYVKEQSKLDKRIVYKGNISNDDMMKKQKEAYFLLNPRPVNDMVSRVTFPSKMIEYMLSGTPVISTKLNGLTKDYSNYINYFEEDNAKSIANGIDYFMSIEYSKLKEKAILGKEFIIKNKNWDRQCGKIYEFINK